MASGGYRPNAGRKKKPAAEKILEGNPGHRPIEVLDLSQEAIEPPSKPPDYLSNRAKNIYLKVYFWLKSIDCLKGILPYNLEEYSFCKDRWMEAEEMVTKNGMVIYDDKGREVASPYVGIAKEYLHQADNAWQKIYQVIRESKLSKWDSTSPNDDVMESLLGGNDGT